MKLTKILLGMVSLVTLGCVSLTGLPFLSIQPIVAVVISPSSTKPANNATTLTPFQPVTNTPSLTPTFTLEPSLTPSITITPRPKPTKKPKPTHTPTSEWVIYGPGTITAPILLYHHVTNGDPPNLYSVSADTFSEQMQYLADQGYTSISISQLVKAIEDGTHLPERPVIITFDDGNLDIYENAYPIMKDLGFTGTLYLVMNYLNHSVFMSSDQVAEMVNHAWEIGSHSMSHPDIYAMQTAISYQIVNSREGLEEEFGIPVNTFAYPYGQTNASITNAVEEEYSSAVGLGKSTTHSQSDIYNLTRIDVRSDMDMTSFQNVLPW